MVSQRRHTIEFQLRRVWKGFAVYEPTVPSPIGTVKIERSAVTQQGVMASKIKLTLEVEGLPVYDTSAIPVPSPDDLVDCLKEAHHA